MGLNWLKCSVLFTSNNCIYFLWIKCTRVDNHFIIFIKSTCYFYSFYVFSSHIFIFIWIHSYNFNFINTRRNIFIIYLYCKINFLITSSVFFWFNNFDRNIWRSQIKHQTIWCINRFISNIIFYKCKYNIVSFLIELYNIFFFPYTIIFNCFWNFVYNCFCIIIIHCNFAGFKTLYFTGSIIRSNKIFFYFILWKVSKSFPVVWKYLIKLSCIS